MLKSTDSEIVDHRSMKRWHCNWLHYAKGEFSMTSGYMKEQEEDSDDRVLRKDIAGAPVAKKDSQEVPVFKIS